ncbi:urease accessory protein UreF [Azospirillum sp. INR13]|uniref:urease accessory protein UreF n=1 Tax=Azospirillum sp. INR13 TaxID=2596919 RepID=UPI00351C39C6
MGIRTDVGDSVSTHALTRLLAWLSPSFPVGGFSYSHGIEAAVEQGLVRDRATMIVWLDGILRHGAGRTDGMLFAAAHRAVRSGGRGRFRLGFGAGRHPARLLRNGSRIAGAGAGFPVGDPRRMAAR